MMAPNDRLYNFVFRGMLTEQSLDRAGRIKRSRTEVDLQETAKLAGLEVLDEQFVLQSREMAVVYTAIAAFENSVRSLIIRSMLENVGDAWWSSSVSKRIKESAASRISGEQQTRWHGQRGEDPIQYTMLPDLLSIIRQNHAHFEAFIPNIEWAAQIFEGIDRSRNVIMHSGVLSRRVIARCGSLIRDWSVQVST